MTNIILKNFNGIAEHKSYGGNSLEENLVNAQKSIEKVQYTERIWDRSRSQHMLKFLACSNADGWLRMRQISAEMYSKRMALQTSKFGYMKRLTEAKIKRDEMLDEKNENKKLLLEIEATQFEAQAAEILIKFEGAMKEVETLGQMHDQLKEKLGDITEANFEKAQTKAHIKRAVMQAVREVKAGGVIRTGNAEYLEQSGMSTTSVLRDILEFIDNEEKSGVCDTGLLHSFLDAMANKYEGAVIQQAEWLGFDPNMNMNITYDS